MQSWSRIAAVHRRLMEDCRPPAFAAIPYDDACVYRADCADAAVAGEDLVAEIAGIGAETPLVNAVVAAECAAAFRQDFEIAPTTEGKVVGTDGQGLPCGAAAGEGAGGEHALSG